MDTAFTEEQDDIRRTVRRMLERRCGPEDLRAAVEAPAGHDEALWKRLAGELGLPALSLPEEYEGVGSTVELALAFEESGRALLPSPLLSTTALGAPLIRALGTAQQRKDLLPAVASGELTTALAVPAGSLPHALGLTTGGDGGDGGDWAGGDRTGGVQARQDEDGWSLYGECDHVLSGHSAGLLLVAARTGGYTRARTLLFLVPATAGGLGRTRLTTLDETRAAARLTLRDTRATPLGEDGADGAAVIAALAHTGARAAALLAAEAVGAADGALARTVEYVGVREQFGRPVGAFQAVRHRLADVYVQVQAARSAAYYAVWAADGPRGAGSSGALALAQGLHALRLAAGEAVQLHGGVGFTWEHTAQLYFKRASSDALLFGPVHRLRAQAAQAEGLFARPA